MIALRFVQSLFEIFIFFDFFVVKKDTRKKIENLKKVTARIDSERKVVLWRHGSFNTR